MCACDPCGRVLIARQKISYLSALRNGKEGGRVEAATHNQNPISNYLPSTVCVCVCVCACDPCGRVLIARQKISYLSALRNGKEGGRVEAATHNQNPISNYLPSTVCVCVCVCACV